MKSLLIGKTNVGKTLFCIHFAQYIGVRDMTWLMERADGRTEQKKMSLREAEETMTDALLHKTRCLQSVNLELPRGKGMRQLILTDSTGLVDGIHPEPEVRQAMAQTLKAMVDAQVILHLVDADEVGRAVDDSLTQNTAWSTLDEQIATFGKNVHGYMVLANKMDLPAARRGYQALCKKLSKHRVIPVSALHGTGFREVKQHVWRLA